MSKYIIAVACYGPPCGHAPLGRRTREGPRAIPREGVNKYIYIYIHDSSCSGAVPPSREGHGVGPICKESEPPCSDDPFPPSLFAHCLCAVGMVFFFKWEGKLRLDPPSLTFSTPRKPLYSRCLAWAPPFHGALPLHRFPATLRQKNLRRPMGWTVCFFV